MVNTAFTIGNSQRTDFTKINSTTVPGPGTYKNDKMP